MKTFLKNYSWSHLLILLGFLAPFSAKAQEKLIPARFAKDEQAQAEQIQQAMDDSITVRGVLNKLGLHNTKVVAGEAFLDFNHRSGEGGFLSTDGPTITVESEISTKYLVPLGWQDSVRLRTSLTMMFNEAIRIDQSRLGVPLTNGTMNWNYFFREAKIIIDIDPKTNSPIATIIAGIQDLESGAFHSAMPIPDNGALRGITRIRSAHAIQVQLNSRFFDALSVAAFNTGAGHPESMGENIKAHAPGATVMMSKKLSEHLQANAALTQISYSDQSEVRLNTGIAYESKEGGYTIFFDHVYLPKKGNPLYPQATSAWTMGAIKQLTASDYITAEVTKINQDEGQDFDEYAIGFKHSLTKRTSFGVGVRKTPTGTQVEARLAYAFDSPPAAVESVVPQRLGFDD